jgi:hypothetical protein
MFEKSKKGNVRQSLWNYSKLKYYEILNFDLAMIIQPSKDKLNYFQ